jgi:hypothetical protein
MNYICKNLDFFSRVGVCRGAAVDPHLMEGDGQRAAVDPGGNPD